MVDNFSDDPRFLRYSNILHDLFTSGRHNAITVILSTQKYNVLAPIIRLNSSALFIFRLKNMNIVNAFIEENSALVDKKSLYDMYQQAVHDAPYYFSIEVPTLRVLVVCSSFALRNALKLIMMNRLKQMMANIYIYILHNATK